MATPKKILVIAEACNPEWTSVPLVGWSHVEALTRHDQLEVHLVTQIRNKESIERFGWTEGTEFTSINSEAIIAPAYNLAKLLRGGAGKGWTMITALASLSYPYFEHLVWKKFGARIKAGEFDLVHRITPLTPTATSSLAKKCSKANVPFIVGPLNGGVPWPQGFDSARRDEKEWLSYVRGVYKFLPGYHSTRRFSSSIIVGSKATYEQVPDKYKSKCVYIPENAIDPLRFPELQEEKPIPSQEPLRAIFIGRLVPYKGVDMLLEAAAPLVKDGLMRIDIYGDGPERLKLESIANSFKINDKAVFHGFISHDKLHEDISKADVFTFPSIREFGGGVVLEAMAVGVVPIVVDYAGPSELVTKDVGFKVSIGSRESIIRDFREQLIRVVSDRSVLHQLQANGKNRIANLFTWDAKADQVYKVYQWILGESLSKPNFDF